MIRLLLAVLNVQIATSGYVTRLLEVNDCNPTPPYAEKPIFKLHLTLAQKDKRSLVAGNFTFYESCNNNCRWFLTIEKEAKGRRKFILRIKDMTCRHVVVKLVYGIIRLPLDYKNCYTKPGTYSFENIDFNQIDQQIRLPFRNNGVYYYTYSVVLNGKTHFCFSAKLLIVLN